jgi:flagellar protein FliO/FliZ
MMSRNSKKMFTIYCAIAVLFSVAGMAAADAAEVMLNRQGDDIVIATGVQADFAGSEASVSAPDSATVEISVAGADFSVDGKRQLFRFEDQSVKTVSVSRDKNNGVIRFNIKEKNAALLADLIRVTRADDHLFVTLPGTVDATGQSIAGTKVISIAPGPSKTDAAAPGVVTESAIKTASLTGGSGDKTGTLAALAIADTKSESTAVLVEPSKDKRAESEIPVFTDKAAVKKAGGANLEKLVMTLLIACAFLGAALFAIKRWAARRGKNIASPTKIQILTQHHLGPKKSLAIIQVAGEAILIGITDQNISMLKTLALIDDEVPGHVPKNFADELDNDSTEARQQLAEEGFEEDNFALKGLNEVRDMVTTRLGKSSRRDA